MKNNIKIFGYGSLMNEDSLKRTVKTAKNIIPVKAYGFIRIFNIREDRCFSRKCKKPISVLNIEKSKPSQFINGICFEMDLDEINFLLEREKQYEFVKIEVEELLENGIKKKYFANTFRVKNSETFDFQKTSGQNEYLQMCLEGARYFGSEFLKEFKETTFIGNKTLKELNF